ncbi:peptidoglycan-binding domain-containing protein [Tepidanaerobacter acetatoxydans]|uniref:peptidoglycan-binding domain-containing protein n=1 Tax=Tepidanaerobacter acetatoxydans TaxID=499229 RepID=UPI001BD50A61|nr:peptidoglycan-binding domain-containing protein [Tepidanaerobacter acetatoxydans]
MKLPVIPFGSRVLKKQKPLLKGSDVRHLQQALKRLGAFNARIDGVFGYETMQAVREFQRDYIFKDEQVLVELIAN